GVPGRLHRRGIEGALQPAAGVRRRRGLRARLPGGGHLLRGRPARPVEDVRGGQRRVLQRDAARPRRAAGLAGRGVQARQARRRHPARRELPGVVMTDRARVHEVLSVPSRVAILDLLRDRSEPLDARELAAETGLHVTTVRFHLSALIEAGLVTERAERSGGRGRPRTVYSASWSAEPEHGPYQELAELLARHFADTPAQPARRGEPAGEEWARRRLNPSAAGAARSVVTAMFAEMGFDPEPTEDGHVLLHGCPFRASARE